MKRILIFQAVVTAVLLVANLTAGAVFAQSTPVSYSLSPSSGTLAKGTQTVNLNINTGGITVSAAGASLVFDPDKMTVASFTYGSIVPAGEQGILQDTEVIDNQNGNIAILGLWLSGYNGSGTFASITFNVLQDSGTASISFEAVDDNTNEVYELDADPPVNVLGSTNGGTYTLSVASGTSTPTSPTTSLPDSGIFDNKILLAGTILILMSATWGVVYVARKRNSA